MSQDSNTTSDTNPKPRLQIARPKDAPPAAEPASPAPAPEASAAVPRFSFARKKPAEAPPPPAAPPPSAPAPAPARPTTGSSGLPLKRPPPGSRLFPANELATPEGKLPTPLTPVTRGATATPFPAKPAPAPRSHTPLLIILGVLVLVVGGESTYILMQDEKQSTVNSAAAPVVIDGGNAANKPTEVSATGPAATPAAKFLQNMPVDFVDAGANPKLSIDGQVFHPGEVVDKETGLKWTMINDKARQLEFVDGHGQHYIKKF